MTHHYCCLSFFELVDGTLIAPAIDFGEMRRLTGVPHGHDILDHLHSLEGTAAEAAHAAILKVEHDAMLRMQLMPGVHELAAYLDQLAIPR